MISRTAARSLALALPEAAERDHHGRPSFRVGGKIFATLWDESHMNVMLDHDGILTAVGDDPDVCAEVRWGRRLAAVSVSLDDADAELLARLLADAWESRAPRRLVAAREVAATARAFRLDDEDLRAWAAAELPDDEFADWLTDRIARRPTGRRARETYGAERVHDFARRAILDALALGPGDRLLEVGCGGGLLLRDALIGGAAAVGLDHSDEMVDLARERAPGAEVIVGDAARLPFDEDAFTAVAMSVVFLFLPDPLVALRECRRVLIADGRIAIYTTSAALRGTPAAPEPLASRSHFHSDAELAELARQAGFGAVVVRGEDGAQLLTAVAAR